MRRLGYDRYGTQGGDWGSAVARDLGIVDAEHVVGVHLNFLFTTVVGETDGLNDSPVGQLAWIVEKFRTWTDSTDVPEEAVDRDQMLTNVMLYWLNGTSGSSARLYKEASKSWGKVEPSTTPTAMAVFPREIGRPVREIAERTNNFVRWTEFGRGGHFAAMEEPDLLAEDVRAFFSELR